MKQQKNKNKTRGFFGFLSLPRNNAGAKNTGAAAMFIARLPVVCLLLFALAAAGDSARGVFVLDDGEVKTTKAESGHNDFWHSLNSLGGAIGDGAVLALRGLPPDDDDARAALRVFVNGGNINFAQWRRARLDNALARLDNDAAAIVASALEDEFGALPSIKRIGVQWNSAFGEQRKHLAFDAIGGWHLSSVNVAGWQGRFYGDGKATRGGNLGLFARSVHGGNLFGINLFADYQKERDISFWRMSFGGEWRSKFGAASINRYWQLGGDKQLPDNFIAYTKEGADARLLIHLPGAEWLSLAGDYYHWRGRYGESDDEGFRYGLRFRPGGGWRAGLYYDDDNRWSADISYEAIIGESNLLAADGIDNFDARIHFWDAVRREYGQRISRVSIRVAEERRVEESEREEEDNNQFSPLSIGIVMARTIIAVGAWQRAALVSVSGGQLIDGNDYRYSVSVPKDGDISIANDGAVSISIANAGLITATIMADDEHVNTAPATILITARAVDGLVLGFDRTRETITAHLARVIALATLQGVGGLAGYDYALDNTRQGVSLSNRIIIASLSIAAQSPVMTSALTATAIIADAAKATASIVITLSVQVINPPSLTITAVLANSIILTGELQAIATISASGGYLIDGGDYRYSALAADGADIIVASDGAVSISIANAGLITATIMADDEHINTAPATILITARAVDGLILGFDRTRETITAHLARVIALATLHGIGGLPGYDYALDNIRQGVSLSNRIIVASLSIAAQSPVMTSALTATAIITDAAKATASIIITLSVQVINPPSLTITAALANSIILTGNLQAIATISASGGYLIDGGSYRYSALALGGADIIVADNGAVSISIVNAGLITATIMADDEHINTAPATILITARAVDGLILGFDRTRETITAHLSRVIALATLRGIGGLPGYDYALDNSRQGVSLSNRVIVASLSIAAQSPLMTSALTATAIITDTAKATASIIITLSVQVINPPSLTITAALANSIILTGNLQAIATISASGGYVINGGDYRYSALAASGADIIVADNGAISISIANAGLITATIMADDEHINTAPATILITTRAVDSLILGFDRTRETITAHLSRVINLATLQGVGGLPGYDYALDSSRQGVSLSNRIIVASLSIAAQSPVITSVLTATAIITDAAKATASIVITLSVQVINPPPLTISAVLANSIILTGDLQAIATISASGGYLIDGGDYRYSALAASGADIIVANDGAVSISIANAGLITATIMADDEHINIAPATILITTRATADLVLGAAVASVTLSYFTNANATLATLRASGGLAELREYALPRADDGISITGGSIVVLSAFVADVSVYAFDAAVVDTLPGVASLSVTASFSITAVLVGAGRIRANIVGNIASATAVLDNRRQFIASISVSGGDAADGYRFSVLHALPSDSSTGDFIMTDTNALLPIINISGSVLSGIASDAFYRRGFAAITFIVDDNNDAIPAAVVSLTAAVVATMATDTSDITAIFPTGRGGIVGTALFYDAQGTLSVLASEGFTLSALREGGIQLSPAQVHYPNVAAADAPDGMFGVYATLSATGVLITGTLVGGYSYGPHIPATALFTISIRGLFGVNARDAMTITTYLTGAVASLDTDNNVGAVSLELLGDSAVSLAGNVLFMTATSAGMHLITITIRAEDNATPSQITASALTISFYAIDPPPVIIGRDGGQRFTIVLDRQTEVKIPSGISASGGYLYADSVYDLSLDYEVPIGGDVVVSMSLADSGMLYVQGRDAAVVIITAFADDDHVNTERASVVLTAVYQRGIGAFAGVRGYTPQNAIGVIGHNLVTVRAGYPFLEAEYAEATRYDETFGGGVVMEVGFYGAFGRPDYTLTAGDLLVRHVSWRDNRIYATVANAESDAPMLAGRQWLNQFGLPELDVMYVNLRLRTATMAARMTATLIVADKKDSGYVPATVIVEVTINRKMKISASVPSGVIVHHHGDRAATLAVLGGESDDMPITYHSVHDIPGLHFADGLIRYMPPVEKLRTLTVTVVGVDSYRFFKLANDFSVHAQSAALTLTMTVVPGVNISVHTLATVFNPGFAGTVGILSVLRGHLEEGGNHSFSFNADDAFSLENGTIFFRANNKGQYTAAIVADDDYGGTLPMTMIITVQVADCKYFSPYCPALNHNAVLAGGGMTIKNARAHLQGLLRAGVDPNEKDGRGQTPMVMFRNADAVGVFVNAGASVNVVDDEQCTPLYYAAGSGALYPHGEYIRPLDAMRILLTGGESDNRADPDADTCGGAKAIHVAYHFVDGMHLLLDNGADINATLTAAMSWEGINHLFRSTPRDVARRRHDAHLRENFRRPARDIPTYQVLKYNRMRFGRCNTYCYPMDVNLDNETTRSGLGGLHLKPVYGDLAMANRTVTLGTVAARYGGRDTQYISSVSSTGNVFTVSPDDSRVLVYTGGGGIGEKTAIVQVRDISPPLTGGIFSVTILVVGQECTYFAPSSCGGYQYAHSGDDKDGNNNPQPRILWQLINAGIDINEREGESQRTPLHVVKSTALARVLLANGASPDLRDSDGRTPLYHHARRLAFGGATPNDGAAKPGAFIDILARQYNANVSIADNYGETPLHLAVNNRAISEMLMNLGAPVNATISKVAPGMAFSKLVGDTPLDNANRYAADNPGDNAAAAIAAKGGRCNNACLPGNVRLDGVTIAAPPLQNPISTLYIIGGAHPNSITSALRDYRILVAGNVNGETFDGRLLFTNPARAPDALELVGHRGAYLNGTVIIAGGGKDTGAFNNIVVWATNAYQWNVATAAFDAVRGHELIVHNNEYILAGGYGSGGASDVVWASADGVEWVRRGSLPRALYNFGMASFNGAIYADGGTSDNGKSGATYRSIDGGRTWITLAGFGGASSAQTGRAHHRLIPHRGMLHMVGGVKNGNTTEKTIWRSIDGMYWRACPDAVTQGYPSAFGLDFDSFSFGGRLFVIGGGQTNASSIKSCDDNNASPWFNETSGLPARYKQRAVVIP